GHRLADRLASDGVLVLDDDAPPGVIAATLATLAVRQSSVDHLRRELSIARRFQGGLSGQMDKLHEELQLAAIVQKELLPKSIPSVPGFDMHVFFRSAGYVSGDIYDVQRLDEHRLGFFVADAVGHGVPAALMTMIIARGMHMTQIRQGEVETLSPAEVLCELNRDLSRQEGNAPRFATAVCGILDGRDRTVRLAGAGHPHPLVLRADGTHRPVETTGGLLGIFAEDSFEEVTVQLEEDELLVVYSDGFETAFPEDGVGGYERRLPTRNYIRCFDQSAAHWRNDGLTAAAMHLAEQVNEQSGSLHQIDDLTAMLIAPNSTGS
ncbi:MAG: PP2C family protein-serine/threonine phosphatase, partial [Planctomycetota bacterium]